MRTSYPLALAAVLLLTAPAHADLMIFSFPDLVAGTTIQSYSVDGFTISAADGFNVGSIIVIGPANTLIPINNDPVTMTRDDGQTWSFDIIAVAGSPLGTTGTLEFAGSIGGRVFFNQAVTVNAAPALEGNTVGFENINSATWTGANYQFSFLMVEFTPGLGSPGPSLPEPSGFVLAAIGMGGAVVGMRRRKAG